MKRMGISRILHYVLSLFCICLCVNCGERPGKAWTLPDDADTLYMPKYAKGFELYGVGRSAILCVKDPWQGARGVEKWVFLARDDERPPRGFDGTVVRVPIRRAVCMSSSHVAFFDALDALSVVSGVSGGRFITNAVIRQKLEQGTVRDVGTEQNVNIELVTALQPDVLFTYGLSGESSVATDRMREMHVPVVYVGEYVENHPLGKAEWIVVMGEMVGRRKEAVTLFDSIEEEYNRVRKLAQQVQERPAVMLNAPWRDTWYVPGDRSYMVRLIVDAGGDYVCRGEDTEQSRPISMESAYVFINQSDVWMGPGAATTLDEVLAENPRLRDVLPVSRGQVYNNNLRRTPEGGSDFWESGTVYPQIILKDMIHIFHPELLPEHQLYYFRKLE